MIQGIIYPNKKSKRGEYTLNLNQIKDTGFNSYFTLQE